MYQSKMAFVHHLKITVYLQSTRNLKRLYFELLIELAGHSFEIYAGKIVNGNESIKQGIISIELMNVAGMNNNNCAIGLFCQRSSSFSSNVGSKALNLNFIFFIYYLFSTVLVLQITDY